jgi:hypothetical protein
VLVESVRYRNREDPEALRRAGDSVVILDANAEDDSWPQITQEYPHVERPSEHDPLVKKAVHPLSCAVPRVAQGVFADQAEASPLSKPSEKSGSVANGQ